MAEKKLSQYELNRLQKIKENQELLNQLFPEGTKLHSSPREATPTVGLIVNRKSSSCRKLKYSARRYNTRQSRDYYEGPMTRSMRTRFGGEEGGEKAKSAEPSFLDDEYHYRVAPRKRRYVQVQEEIEIELDDRPGLDVKYLKRVVDSNKSKIYDRINGTTCHQCRQKTIDQKTVCHNKYCNGVRGQFCGPCLKNRYGEDIRECLVDKTWVCPPCRGKCNCSFCLPKKGCPPTGIMIHIAKEAGYDSVQEYLEKSDYNY
ncbi:PREDICTED: cell division cycle-associated 7-like protein [Amphimedon queenslandica]|uniref:Zinc-finger domain-containing protein n=1 Tax=Amphimedon queenslandica TaxID=400682 RepID=A0A1X7VWG1_AMPQE|nr:PREDICTED: cell division cycle-associated 7-like protein [Amphimedon queenslandica]|eukprot:XP_003382727.2 PREDICTED: cell division cycle-associated 7-like protein [Amphimedon queenslandica]